MFWEVEKDNHMEGISGVKSQGITKAALTREKIWEALEEMKVEDRNEFYIEGHNAVWMMWKR